MPYVFERRPAPHRLVRHGHGGGSESLFPYGHSLEQYGFRSGKLDPQVRRAIAIDSQKHTWATSKRLIEGYHYEYSTRSDRQGFVVNDRDFVSKGHIAASADYTCSYSTQSNPVVRQVSGVLGIGATVQGSTASKYFPSQSRALSDASQMMRDSVPTAPAMDLLRAIGELRDAPLMLRMSNYRPTSLKEGGSAYLNMVFGVIPTISDVKKLCESVLASDRIIRSLIRNEDRQVRRTRTRSYADFSLSGVFRLNNGITTQTHSFRDGSEYFGSITLKGPLSTIKPGSAWTVPVQVRYELDSKSVIRSFATYEYFVPRPTGILSRFDSYVLHAKYVLGLELEPSTVYDLTAWTWLFNWAVDISGLLRYQQAVQDNQVVMNRSGYVREMVTTLSLVLEPVARNYNRILSSTWATEKVSAKTQHRRPGGPYSLLQPWELSASQAAILTALGLSRWSPK